MGGFSLIKITCDNCGRKLEAPDGAEGRKGKCPGCGEVFHVPGAGWRLKKPGGKVYPADSAALKTWIGEGRVSAEDMLAPGGGEDWKPAGSVEAFAGLFPASGEGKTCPGCKKLCTEKSVICTSCGLNLSTGEKIGSEVSAPSGVKGTRGRLAFEGGVAGALSGAVVLVVLLLVDILIKHIFGGRSAALDNFFRMLIFWAAAGAVFGIVIGIVTALTHSAKAGTFTGIFLMGAGLLLIFLASPLAGLFMLIGAVFWGFIVYLAGSAISQSVIKMIRWEKYY